MVRKVADQPSSQGDADADDDDENVDTDDADVDTDDVDTVASAASAAAGAGTVRINLAKVGVDNIQFRCYRQCNWIRILMELDTNPRVCSIRIGIRTCHWDSYPIALGSAYGIRIQFYWETRNIEILVLS